jgi:hypothetical protein
MRRISLLFVLSALLAVGCRHSDHRDLSHYSPDRTTTLKVILNGPYVLVRTNSQPNMITVFSPRDREGLHRFYSNDVLQEDGLKQNVRLTLAPDGLKPEKKLSVDQYYPRDFVVDTPKWVPTNDNFVTIELPLPEKITFASPLHQVTLENGARRFMATNFILEYRVTESGKVNATSNELGSLHPLSISALQKQYETLCQRPDVKEKYYNYYESCANMRNLLEQSAGSRTALFFFGVGIPLKMQLNMGEEEINAHAVDFFNNFMLKSFPKWNGPRLATKGAFVPQGNGNSTPMLMEASFRPAAPRPPRMLPVTAVIDCKAGNVIVKTAQ